jgi:hypothetical protein
VLDNKVLLHSQVCIPPLCFKAQGSRLLIQRNRAYPIFSRI